MSSLETWINAVLAEDATNLSLDSVRRLQMIRQEIDRLQKENTELHKKYLRQQELSTPAQPVPVKPVQDEKGIKDVLLGLLNYIDVTGSSIRESSIFKDADRFLNNCTATPAPVNPVGDVMRWVKASERLPDDYARVSWRFTNKSFGGLCYIPRQGFSRGEKFTKDFQNIEWLDESKSILPIDDNVMNEIELLEECKRLAGVAEYWQQKYYDLNPPTQPIKLDNL